MSSQQQPHQPQQQRPEYRSVKMAAPAMPPPLRSPFSRSEPTNKLRMNPVHSIPLAKSTTTTTTPTSKPWTLCNPLPMVPAGYRLERNQIHIASDDNHSQQEIANRISECLHLRSFVLSETTTSSDIKNAFRAESSKGLLFRINFFQSSQKENLTIEFQRLAGCSYEFQKTYQAIHRCVCLPESEQDTKHELEFPTCAMPPIAATQEEKSERLLDTFEIAMDMLSSDRIDCQLMGLEVLEPMSTNPEIATLLLQKNDSNHLSKLLGFCTGSPEALSELEEQQECLLKRRGLSILANALETQSSSSNADQSMVMDTLLSCLDNNNNNRCGADAHQSFQVVRCLVVLSPHQQRYSPQLLRAMSLLANDQGKEDLPFLKQECQKLESMIMMSS